MAGNTKRTAQVGERIRELVATMLIRGEVRDPRVKKVTIHSVKVSPDLQSAKVYYSVFGTEDEKKSAQEGLEKASGFIRNFVGKELEIRYTPVISFFYDEGIEHARHMQEVFAKLKEQEKEISIQEDNPKSE